MISVQVGEDAAGFRFDACAAKIFGITRASAQKLIEDGHILLNSRIAQKKTRVKAGDMCAMEPREAAPSTVKPEDIPLDIIYEDSEIIIINKPRGMVVHPAPGHYGGTLVNALMYRFGSDLSGINGALRPGIVHRIDRDTSGILAAAKTDRAHVSLAAQLEAHSMDRVYYAIANGVIAREDILINRPIGRHPADRKKMAVTEKNGKPAVTRIHVLERFRCYTYIKAELETGRTHQIRVHMSAIGHPLLGDEVYGRADPGVVGGQILHAGLLGLTHPVTKEHMVFETDLPSYFTDALVYVKNR